MKNADGAAGSASDGEKESKASRGSRNRVSNRTRMANRVLDLRVRIPSPLSSHVVQCSLTVATDPSLAGHLHHPRRHGAPLPHCAHEAGLHGDPLEQVRRVRRLRGGCGGVQGRLLQRTGFPRAEPAAGETDVPRGGHGEGVRGRAWCVSVSRCDTSMLLCC